MFVFPEKLCHVGWTCVLFQFTHSFMDEALDHLSSLKKGSKFQSHKPFIPGTDEFFLKSQCRWASYACMRLYVSERHYRLLHIRLNEGILYHRATTKPHVSEENTPRFCCFLIFCFA